MIKYVASWDTNKVYYLPSPQISYFGILDLKKNDHLAVIKDLSYNRSSKFRSNFGEILRLNYCVKLQVTENHGL